MKEVLANRRIWLYVGGIAGLVYLAILVAHALTLKPWNDEAMAANASYNLSYRGYTGVPFYDEQAAEYPGVHEHTYYMLPGQFPVLAIWYRIAGVSLFSTRLASMLWSFAGFFILYKLLRRLTLDTWIPALAVGLTMVDYQIMSAASFSRYDTMVATLGFGAYLAYLALRERNLGWAVVCSHSLVVFSGLTHPNGVFYLVGLLFLMWYYDRSRLGWKQLALMTIPYLVGGVLIGAYIFQDFASFRGQMARNSGGRFGLLHPWATFLSEIQYRYIRVFGLGDHSAGHASPLVRLKAVPLVVYLASVIGCFLVPSIRRNTTYRPLFALAAIHWFLLTFYENMKFSYYLVHLIPFYAAITAILVVTLVREKKLPPVVAAVGLLAVAGLQVGGILLKVRENSYGNRYAPAVDYVKQHAGPDDLVYASCGFGFRYGFDSDYRDDETFGYFSGEPAKFIVMEEIYDDRLPYYQSAFPKIYQHMRQTLDSYELVYKNDEYRVYRRPEDYSSAENRPVPQK